MATMTVMTANRTLDDGDGVDGDVDGHGVEGHGVDGNDGGRGTGDEDEREKSG